MKRSPLELRWGVIVGPSATFAIGQMAHPNCHMLLRGLKIGDDHLFLESLMTVSCLEDGMRTQAVVPPDKRHLN